MVLTFLTPYNAMVHIHLVNILATIIHGATTGKFIIQSFGFHDDGLKSFPLLTGASEVSAGPLNDGKDA